MCGPRQLFFFQCGPEIPKVWTALLQSKHFKRSQYKPKGYLWSSLGKYTETLTLPLMGQKQVAVSAYTQESKATCRTVLEVMVHWGAAFGDYCHEDRFHVIINMFP